MQEAQAPLPTGTVLHEHYMVESLLGKGDFGNVYLVRDQRDEQKLFALAELINATEGERYRFTLDYVSLAQLDRRVLPRVQYVFNDDKLGRAYLLMSSIEEMNLEMLRLQQAEKHFPLAQVITTMTPVINAVAYLHGRYPPVIHRNIKPASIFVSRTGDAPVLAMLNIFKEHDSTTTALHYLVPGYGAPEQYSGEFSSRTDIYGLGATCYTLLTGIVPPDALSRSTQQSNGEIDPLRPVNEVIPAIPTLIAEAIQRAMSINADERFSSVEQLREVLVSSARQSRLRLSPIIPSTPSPPSALAPEEPAIRHPEGLNGLRPAASRQAVEKAVPVPMPPPLESWCSLHRTCITDHSGHRSRFLVPRAQSFPCSPRYPNTPRDAVYAYARTYHYSCTIHLPDAHWNVHRHYLRCIGQCEHKHVPHWQSAKPGKY